MPLSPKQRKIVAAGEAACKQCGDLAARLRALGFPNEALEERQQASAKFYEAAREIVSEWESTKGKGGSDGTE